MTIYALGSPFDPSVAQQPPRVLFDVTVRNNASRLDRCLRSIAAQDYDRLAAVVTDDASEDATAAVAARWVADRPDLFTLVRNSTRRWKTASFDAAVELADDHDVVVELDGDDALLVPDAARELARLHQRMDLVWTQHAVDRRPHGTWTHWRSTDLPVWWRNLWDPPRLLWTRTFFPGHVRSCKAWAYRLIDKDHLKIDGRWLRVAGDVAYFAPLLEMCPPALRYFYDRELAVYSVTEDNDHLRSMAMSRGPLHQSWVSEYLAGLEPYRTVDSPLWVGLLSADRQGAAVAEAVAAELARNPATRAFLGQAPGGPTVRHPRVQTVELVALPGYARLKPVGRAAQLALVTEVVRSAGITGQLRVMDGGELPLATVAS